MYLLLASHIDLNIGLGALINHLIGYHLGITLHLLVLEAASWTDIYGFLIIKRQTQCTQSETNAQHRTHQLPQSIPIKTTSPVAQCCLICCALYSARLEASTGTGMPGIEQLMLATSK